jgi:hypothetical protein
MKNYLSTISLIIVVLLSTNIIAQDVTGKVGHSYRIQLNKISLPISNDGILADVNLLPHGTMGRYDNTPFLYSGGFYISGLNNSDIWVRGQAQHSLITDFISGKIGDYGNQNNQIYIVKSSDQPFSKSWIDWIDAVNLGAKFYDGDQNGVYEPIDKNQNKAWDLGEDMPDLLGDISVWCVYNDGKLPATHLTRFPQGIEIAQTIFGSTSQQYLKNILFIRYSITYRGSNISLDSVYFSTSVDPDIGFAHENDKSGCDKSFEMSYAYQDTLDSDAKKIPFFFISFLQGPEFYTGNVSDKSNVNYGNLIGEKQNYGHINLLQSSFYNYPALQLFPQPVNDLEIYNLMKGRDNYGNQFIPCEFSEISDFVNVNCDMLNPYFMYEGNPFTPYGWIMSNSKDVRMLSNIGPFTLKKDTAQEIIIAYAIGSSQTSLTDAFNSGKQSVIIARGEWSENFPGLSYTNITQFPEPIVWKYYHLSQNYPNPFNPKTRIAFEIPRTEFVKLKVYNSLGEEVITLINEEKSAGRYEIEFDGNMYSSGIYLCRIDAGGFIESRKMILLK